MRLEGGTPTTAIVCVNIGAVKCSCDGRPCVFNYLTTANTVLPKRKATHVNERLF